MTQSTTITVDDQKYNIKLMSVRCEEDVPRLIEFARQSILQSDMRPVSGVIEVEGVLVKISAVPES